MHAIQTDGQNYAVWTGLQSDWVAGANCGQWSGVLNGLAGKAYKVDAFLDAAGHQSCEIDWGLICVQQ